MTVTGHNVASSWETMAALPTYAVQGEHLDDLELLLSGAYAPLDGYLAADVAAHVTAEGRLPDGRSWALPLRLSVPDGVLREATARGSLLLTDLEGTPLARLDVAEAEETAGGGYLAGNVTGLRPAAHGPVRALRRLPAEVAVECSGTKILAAAFRTVPTYDDVAAVRAAAARSRAGVLLVALVGEGSPVVVGARGLVRAVRAAADLFGQGTRVIAVPLPAHAELAAQRRTALLRRVLQTYGATAVLERPADAASLDPQSLPPASLAELRRARPTGSERGAVVLLTGLSGSGKSTIARALADRLAEDVGREVTLLDGDEVRRVFSAGLGFSRPDRETNVRRIGYVASLAARHGGLAVAAPIAPYAQTRAEVRAMAEQAGEFVLVHVATPLSVCEARDRKGLYAKARAGLIPAFTGVSDPYEPPDDADVMLDTAQLSVDEAVETLLAHLRRRGLFGAGED